MRQYNSVRVYIIIVNVKLHKLGTLMLSRPDENTEKINVYIVFLYLEYGAGNGGRLLE